MPCAEGIFNIIENLGVSISPTTASLAEEESSVVILKEEI
jgi:hypothetical protein